LLHGGPWLTDDFSCRLCCWYVRAAASARCTCLSRFLPSRDRRTKCVRCVCCALLWTHTGRGCRTFI
jgi:hypothetical protein